MKHLQTRQQKVKFLQDLQQGKTSLQEIVKPITGVIYIHNGKVFAHQTTDGYKQIEPEIELCDYKQQHTHQVIFEDFSKT